MSMLCIEVLKGIIVIPCTFLQFPPVFKHVDVLQTVVIGIYIILIAALTDIQHTHVFAVEIYDGGAVSLIVDVAMACGIELDDSISHKKIVEVIAGIAECQRLEIGNARTVFWEELIVETFLAKSLVGIYGK